MSDQTAPRRSYHHGDLRTQLIAAVGDLVESHGPDGFSVAEAARRAGVSSAAPYKHFRDRPELLRAVASEGMDRLRGAMEAAASHHPAGSLTAVAAIGQAYVDFARSGPGVFRLVLGLTEGHEDAPHLQEKGTGCFAVVLRAVAAVLDAPAEANRTTGATPLIITHNATIQQIADRTLRFADGRIVDEVTNPTRMRPDQMSW